MKHEYKNWYELFLGYQNAVVDVFVMGIGVFFLAVFSNIQIPLWPVPITMQTFGVFCAAFFFGARKSLMTVALYTLAGVLGLGVFASFSSGPDVILGPTGGYIIGFSIAAFVAGLLIEKGYGRTVKSVLGVLLIATGIIYLMGLGWLWMVYPEETLLTILNWGLFPFLIGEVLKIGLAAAVFPVLWKTGEKRRGG